MAKPLELFGAYEHGLLPPSGGGFIFSIFYDNDENSLYTRYEIVSYNNVKDIMFTSGGLWFKSDGYKVHILLEPNTYPQRFQEPLLRDRGKSIPYKFADLEIFNISARNDRVMISKKPQFNFSSFTIQKPQNDDISVFFRDTDSKYEDIAAFCTSSMKHDIGASAASAKKTADYLVNILKKIEFKSYD